MISTYSDLQGAVASWLARGDLAATIPDFIALFEATANRRLRVRQQEATVSLTPSAGSVALPVDYLAWRRLTWTGNSRADLTYVEPSWLQAAYPTAPAGVPQVFTIEGGAILIRPVDAAVLEFLYFQKIPPLSSDAPVNWLLTEHPDLYLFGALAESYGFTVDPEKLALWKARRDELFEEVTALSAKSRGAGAMRPAGPTP
jgi:hypothetical protein